MKQPELGKRISELRKSKGLTQEELVEQCNISVRTIQRIETGEVTPRSYTIKTILSALDYDISDIRTNKPVQYDAIKWLKFGWIAGLAYFFLGFPEGIADMMKYADELRIDVPEINQTFYMVTKILVGISFIFFMRAFLVLGTVKGADLLKLIAIIQICLMVGAIGFDIATLFIESEVFVFVLLGLSVTYGVLSVGFGIGLYKLRSSFGTACVAAAFLEIFAGLFFMVMLPIGFLFQMPAIVLECVILYRAVRLFSTHPEVE